MKFREQENNYKQQAKTESLKEMKLFSQYEKEKDEEERQKKLEMQMAYRNALQSQEHLKAKQKLNTEIKINSATVHGGTADSLYTFGGGYIYKGPISSHDKGYINRNPILNPISDTMYNPYLRKDINEGNHEYAN